MGTIFVAGAYGVGKSTMCELLSARLCVPTYSAGDLISRINGELYGTNKAVQDKNKNQEILTHEVKRCLKQHPTILLAGHFCIFDKHNNVEVLPENVFESLCLECILLLEADKAAISKRGCVCYIYLQHISFYESCRLSSSDWAFISISYRIVGQNKSKGRHKPSEI